MCVAIFASEGCRPSKSALKISFRNNKDGAGFAYAYNNELIVGKGFFKFEEFYREYIKIPKNAPMLLHFRRATHGPKNVENCHPWIIDQNHAMIHNGVIKQCNVKNSKLSDTGRFVVNVLQPMFYHAPEIWQLKWMKELLEDYIGIGNKIAILSNTGKWVILRGEYGIWQNGCWFSNDGFRRRQFSTYTDLYSNLNIPRQQPKSSTAITQANTQISLFPTMKTVDDELKHFNELAKKGTVPPKISKYAEDLIRKNGSEHWRIEGAPE